MARPVIPKDIDVLAVFVDEMEEHGANRNLVRLTIDANFAEKLSAKLKTEVALETAHKLADRCLANEWLEHTSIGSDQYGVLKLTATGFGVVCSKQKSDAQKKSRTRLKKLSDMIEDHKGLAVAIGVLVALAGVAIKFL
jgi:hypothetical protein